MSLDFSKLHLDWGSCKYKGKVYRSYSLARPYRVDGKNKKEKIIKLGKLSDNQVLKWRNFLKSVKDPKYFFTSFDDICTEKHYAFLDVAVASIVWGELGLDKVFQENGKRQVSIAALAHILSINRCINPVSKSKVSKWFCQTVLPWILDINPNQIYSSRIFRELAVIEDYKDAICKYLFELFRKSYPKSMESLFYDLSSTNFEGTKCKLMK